jgi:tRNA-specific 2-thiouridylase
VADKPESQEVCFVPRDYRPVVRERVGAALRSGPIRHVDGRVLGSHAGLADFTVGQRKGLGLSLGYPLYVVSLDPATDTVMVGDDRALWAREAILEGCNYIACPEPGRPLRVRAKARYAQPEAEATVTPLGCGRASLRFDAPQRAMAPGQAAVWYDSDDPDVVVGGGTIAAVPAERSAGALGALQSEVAPGGGASAKWTTERP